ncbi:MAG: acyl-ACP--UDP-N-acetylglucosamine O-acyltransferase [Candidatus Orphnella occulta]|nr:acyl-ACP--UDP-N-acetylglucosamine O-acyltransferase [Candidatus Orphnella occulta]MDP8296817.1 acyl-ACP--UDP-N-acetylglucosamine O-acyltransferase [Candidatus Orphnella occulta]
MSIHKTAIISKDAILEKGVSVGPYSVINGNVVIGAGTEIGPHCVIDEFTTIGKDCKIFSGAIIGSISQDKKFNEKRSFLEIGNNNTIREYVTINRGTEEESKTIIGDNCLFMAYSHVAHDCRIGDNVVLANCGTLAGYVELEDHVIMGGLAAAHQFVRIGRLSIIGGCSKVVQDVVPYSMADGHPARIYTVNTVGLDRVGFTDDQKDSIKRAFKIMFSMKLNIKNALLKIEKELTPTPEITTLLDFIKSAERGISR